MHTYIAEMEDDDDVEEQPSSGMTAEEQGMMTSQSA